MKGNIMDINTAEYRSRRIVRCKEYRNTALLVAIIWLAVCIFVDSLDISIFFGSLWTVFLLHSMTVLNTAELNIIEKTSLDKVELRSMKICKYTWLAEGIAVLSPLVYMYYVPEFSIAVAASCIAFSFFNIFFYFIFDDRISERREVKAEDDMIVLKVVSTEIWDDGKNGHVKLAVYQEDK